MKRLHSISILIVALLLSCGSSGIAATQRCSVCRHLLERHYLTYQGKACCSASCVDQLRPTCSICRKTIRGEFLNSEDQTFCSHACFTKTLPKCEICSDPIKNGFKITRHSYCSRCIKQAPICFSCGLPAAHPTQLKDGREICNTCMRWAVKTPQQAEAHYARARRLLEAWTGLKIETLPTLELVSRSRMRELSKDIRKTDSSVLVRGLYSRQTYMTKRGLFGKWKENDSMAQEKIYIVDHLHDEVFRTAALHELMHDLIHEHFPQLKDAPLWVNEGICQQAAAEHCRRRNYADILYGIEHCSDPDYGDGYRYINKLTGFNGWRALEKWMNSIDPATLPKTAPR